MQIIRWYLCELQLNVDGRATVSQATRSTVAGRWTTYRLPGNQWGLCRVRGEETEHALLAAVPGVFTMPRGTIQRWNLAASQPLKNQLTALGIVVAGNPFPSEVVDLIGQKVFDRYGNGTVFDRRKERRAGEDGVEEQA